MPEVAAAPAPARAVPPDTIFRYPQLGRARTADDLPALAARARRLRPSGGHGRVGLIHGWQLERAVRLAESGTSVCEAIRTGLGAGHLHVTNRGIVLGTRRTAPRGTFGPEKFRVCLERALLHIASVEAGLVACEVLGALGNFAELDGLCWPPLTAWEFTQLLCACSRHALDPAKVAWTLNRIGAHRRKVGRQQRKQYRPLARKDR